MTCRLSELICAEDIDGSVLFFTTYGWDKIFSRTFEVNPDDDKSRVENSRSMSTSSKLRGEEALPARVEETLSYVTSSVWRLDDLKSNDSSSAFRKVLLSGGGGCDGRWRRWCWLGCPDLGLLLLWLGLGRFDGVALYRLNIDQHANFRIGHYYIDVVCEIYEKCSRRRFCSHEEMKYQQRRPQHQQLIPTL